MSHKIITTDLGSMSYQIEGNGPAVCLLHGFAEDNQVWHNCIPTLKNNHTIITPNLPGIGASTIVSKEAISIDTMAKSINDILVAENIERAFIIGHSMGGYISLAFAKLYPHKLLGLGLVHSTAYADTAEKIGTRKKSIEFIQTHGAAAFIKTTIPNLFYDIEVSKNAIKQQTFIGEAIEANTLVTHYLAMIDRKATVEVLEQCKVPVLFVMGKHDKTIPFLDSLQQSHLPNTSFVHILNSSAHMGMLEQPALFNEILAKFLQDA